MYWLVIFVVFEGCFADPQCNTPSPLPRCQTNENIQLERFLKSTLYRVLTGRTCSVINQMDPLYLDVVVGNFASFQYNNTNITISGLRKSRITSLKVSDDAQVVALKLDVPGFLIEGSANVSGYILYLPSNGVGDLYIEYGRTLVKVYGQLIQVDGSNGCRYIQFGNFSLNTFSLSPFSFNVTPIFDSCSENVTQQRNRFMEEYWEDMAFFGQEPVLSPTIQKLLIFANEYLLNIPLNDLLGGYNVNNSQTNSTDNENLPLTLDFTSS